MICETGEIYTNVIEIIDFTTVNIIKMFQLYSTINILCNNTPSLFYWRYYPQTLCY